MQQSHLVAQGRHSSSIGAQETDALLRQGSRQLRVLASVAPAKHLQNHYAFQVMHVE